jgi:hypothetical protein
MKFVSDAHTNKNVGAMNLRLFPLKPKWRIPAQAKRTAA